MKSIWKFSVPVLSELVVNMPSDAQVLHVDSQNGELMMWALVNPDSPITPRKFRVIGTGHPIYDEQIGNRYIGTVLLDSGQLVLHVFESQE